MTNTQETPQRTPYEWKAAMIESLLVAIKHAPNEKRRDQAIWDVVDDVINRIFAAQPAAPQETAQVCGEPAPDRSGRSCDKPKDHEGPHWTYGGNAMTWARDTPPPADREALDELLGLFPHDRILRQMEAEGLRLCSANKCIPIERVRALRAIAALRQGEEPTR